MPPAQLGSTFEGRHHLRRLLASPGRSTWPEMISGCGPIDQIESTSSITQYWNSRWHH